MKGKDKCEFLKGIRKRMAEANGIPYEPRECTYEGECTGTCPFCEKEAAELMAKLRKKEAEGEEIKTDLFCIEVIESMHKDPGSIPYHLTVALTTTGASDEGYEERLRQLQEQEMKRIMDNEGPLTGRLRGPYEEMGEEEKETRVLLREEEERSKRERERGLVRKFLSKIKGTSLQGEIEEE